MTLSDLRTVLTWFGPEWIHGAAEDYGTGGDKVLGAPLAFDEARRLAREYIRFVRWRDNTSMRDLRLALLFRATGYSPGLRERRHVLPLGENDWRETAVNYLWPGGPGLIPGAVQVDVGAANQARVNRAAILATSRMLQANLGVNRAILDGRVWKRRTAEVMIHASLKAERIRSMVFDCHDKDQAWLAKRMRRAVRAILATEKHEIIPGETAAQAGVEMMRSWMGRFLVSPAGAMISLAPKVPLGWAALVPNGVPLAITVCGVESGKAWVTATIDHRALDGDAAGKIYEWMRAEVPRALEE